VVVASCLNDIDDDDDDDEDEDDNHTFACVLRGEMQHSIGRSLEFHIVDVSSF